MNLLRRTLFSICFSVSALAQTPAITKVWVTDTSHSVTQIHFNSTGSWGYLRIRYVKSPGTCTSGRGGSIEATGYGPGLGQAEPNVDMRQPLGGLLPDTAYDVCPEISTDNVNWSSGAGTTVKTLALPNPHPAPPLPPATFDTSYPNTAGYDVVTVARDCHDFVSYLKSALKNQTKRGTIIDIPAGTVCSGQYYLEDRAADVITFSSSAVNTTRNTITVAHHGYAEGQGIIFGTWYACLPGSNVHSPYCNNNDSGPIAPGEVYYAHIIDPNTIQVYRNAPMASSGTLCVLANPGSESFNPSVSFEEIVKWPRPLKWIIIRTATPDREFDPEHVRITPAWTPKMAVLQMPNTYRGTQSDNILFSTNSQDGGQMSMNANIRIVGIEFTYSASPEAPQSSDPVPHFELASTNNWNQNIIFDRCYFHSLPPPDRTNRAFWWNGMNQAIVDSYIDNMQFYHPMYSGFAIKHKSKAELSIGPGTYRYGSGQAALKDTIRLVTSGDSGEAKATGLIYFTMKGDLNIALPPGVSGTCSGDPRCHVFTTSNKPGNGVAHYGNGGIFPEDSWKSSNYFADPIFSTSSSGLDATSLFRNDAYVNASPASGKPVEVGVRFTSDTDGYLIGVRFAKSALDKGPHTASLWSAHGDLLATASFKNESPSGWQTVKFNKPIPISARQIYVASYHTSSVFLKQVSYFQNATSDNGHLHAVAGYEPSNGSCNFSDSWPKDFLGNTAGGELACITFSHGSITAVSNADPASNQFDTEGCQCMIGGLGPGPYAFVNNYVEGSGVVWHHDDGGGQWARRADYYYYRNRFHVPSSEMFGGPESDGMRYFHRQALEWKAGQRIFIGGNVFDGAWVEDVPLGGFIQMSSVMGPGIRDVDIQNNTFKHGAGVMTAPTAVTGGTLKPPPSIRFRFTNNLIWDINGFKYCTHGQALCPAGGGYGVIFAGSSSDEDWIVTHNTIVGNTGAQPSLLWMAETRVEGMQFTNNIFYLSPGYGEGLASGNVLGLKGQKCGALFGKEAADCALQNYVFEHNLLTGTEGRGEIRSWWPGLSNSVPAKPSDLSELGKVVRDPIRGEAEFEPNDDPPEDRRGFGADVKALEAAQGKVRLAGVPATSITDTSASVLFTAPDKAGCPVDYSSSDPTVINAFTRVADPGGSVSRSIALPHLSANTNYYYRVNCAVEQPKGQFRTR